MIWLGITLCTEILLTGIAPDSMIGHVLSSLNRYRVSIVVFLALDNFSRFHHHDISTRTTDHIGITFYHVLYNRLINFVLLFFVQILFQLEILDILVASWTENYLVVRLQSDSLFSQAVYVHHMEAVCRLKHCAVIRLLVSLVDLFLTEFAKPVFSFLLHLFVIGLSPESFAGLHKVIHVHFLDFLFLLSLVWRLESCWSTLFGIAVRRRVYHFHVSLLLLFFYDHWPLRSSLSTSIYLRYAELKN
jgi:hypothetical protein